MDSKDWIIWGAGKNGFCMKKLMEIGNNKVLFFVDMDTKKIGTRVENVEVKSVLSLQDSKDCNICVSVVENTNKIINDICDTYKMAKENVFHYITCICNIFNENLEFLSEYKNRVIQNTDKKVLWICSSGLSLGGVESWILTFSKYLDSLGYSNVYAIPEDEDNLGLDTVKLPENFFYGITGLHELKQYMDVIIRNMPCVIVIHWPEHTLIAAHLLKCLYPDKLKIILVDHGGRDEYIDKYVIYHPWVDIIIGVSKYGICDKLQKKGVPSSKIRHIVCPVTVMDNFKRKYSIDDREPIKIGFAARLMKTDVEKRSDYLIPLIEQLVLLKVNFVLSIAGDGDYKEVIEGYIHGHRYDKYVRFEGLIERNKMPEFWRKQDIFLSVSDSEGNSMSMLEAMGQGVVPVLTDVSGVRDSVIHGINGYIVKCGDIAGLCKYIEHISNNRDSLKIMGEKAWGKIFYDYGADKMRMSYRQIIDELMAGLE